MESKRTQFLLTAVLLLATGYFGHSLGRQTGDQEASAGRDRQLADMRRALTAGSEWGDDIYYGDSDFEDEDEDRYRDGAYFDDIPDASDDVADAEAFDPGTSLGSVD